LNNVDGFFLDVPFCQCDAVANAETSLRRLRKKSIEATKAKGMASMVNSEEPRNKLENLGFIKLASRLPLRPPTAVV